MVGLQRERRGINNHRDNKISKQSSPQFIPFNGEVEGGGRRRRSGGLQLNRIFNLPKKNVCPGAHTLNSPMLPIKLIILRTTEDSSQGVALLLRSRSIFVHNKLSISLSEGAGGIQKRDKKHHYNMISLL